MSQHYVFTQRDLYRMGARQGRIPVEEIKWVFRNLPVSTPVFVVVCIIILGTAFSGSLTASGCAMIAASATAYVYVLVRYGIIGYRLFSKVQIKTSVLVVIDLNVMEFFCIGGIVTGMYLIDTTPDKTQYIVHSGFHADVGPYFAWWYIVMATIAALVGTGYSSIIDNDLAAASVFSIGMGVSYFSTMILVAAIVSFWAEHYVRISAQESAAAAAPTPAEKRFGPRQRNVFAHRARVKSTASPKS